MDSARIGAVNMRRLSQAAGTARPLPLLAGIHRRLSGPPIRKGEIDRTAVWKLAGLALAAAYLVFIVQFLDRRLLAALHDGHWTTTWLAATSDLGKFHWYMLPALGVFLATAVADWRCYGRRGRALLTLLCAQSAFALAVLVLTFCGCNLLKLAVGRARPLLLETYGAAYFSPLSPGYAFASFPSGHATALGTVAGILTIWAPSRRWLILGIFLTLAFSRVAAGAHYPSDVAAGFCFGLLVTFAAARWAAARRLGFRPIPGRLLPGVRFGAALAALCR